MSWTSLVTKPTERVLLKGDLHWLRDSLPVHALVDSGADGDFIDKYFVSQANIPTVLLTEPREVAAIDGNVLVKITHVSSPLTLTLSGSYREELRLFMISSPQSPLVMGLPWMMRHNPSIDWATASIRTWRDFCNTHCLHSAVPAGPPA